MSLPDLDQAEEVIRKIFGNTAVTREHTRDDLEQLRDLIEDYLAALDDIDTEHDYTR